MNNNELLNLYEELVEPFAGVDSEYRICKSKTEEDNFTLTCVPTFVGKKYGTEKIKLMLVGRAVNGWNIDWAAEPADIAKQALSIDFDMNSIDKEPLQNKGTADEYNFNQCAFIKLGKSVAKKLGLESEDIADNLIWSNLYKVAPSISGNPNGKVQKMQRQSAIKILQKEIELYRPSHILFVTDIDWLQYTWRNDKSELNFAKVLGIEENLLINNSKYVKAFGKIEQTSYVVCVRPEKRKIEEMAEDIITAYTLV